MKARLHSVILFPVIVLILGASAAGIYFVVVPTSQGFAEVLDEADAHRARGLQLFEEGKYTESISAYTLAISRYGDALLLWDPSKARARGGRLIGREYHLLLGPGYSMQGRGDAKVRIADYEAAQSDAPLVL